MHGIIFRELRKFTERYYPTVPWATLLDDAKLSGKIHYSIQLYPDADAQGIIQALAQRTEQPEQALLYDFGQFIQPTLLMMYTTLADPKWRTLDIIEHVESRFHSVVIQRHSAAPPKLDCIRIAPNKVRIIYGSHRRMCALAEGVVRGLGQHYSENLRITHDVCMHKGAATCQIEVTLLAD